MLPKISQPTFSLILPSTKKEIRYRSFTVKEEKLLMIAQASGERADYVNCFKQLISNCCVDPIDVDQLASYDIEYFFLMLRAKSVSNVINLIIKDDHGKDIDVQVNLNDVKVHESTVPNKIVLDPEKNIGIKMKYPTFGEIATLSRKETGAISLDDGLDLFISLIEMIWEGDAVFLAKDSSREELEAFVDDFNPDQVAAVEGFLEDLPFVYLDVNYKDSTGEEVTTRITGIDSFFE
jgi:hypothetical protein